MAAAFVFPGQGAQHVGMGRDLCDIHSVAAVCFREAEDITGLPLARLCFEGPEEELARTDVSQPAIFTMSMAMLFVARERLADRLPDPLWFAGLSLGEYSALCAAGSISFHDGLRLVQKRGRYMQEAATAVPGGMLCVLGADDAVADRICQAAGEAGMIRPANLNCPGQIVLSGEAAAIRKAAEVAEDCGANGVVELNVAGAFHSPLMQPAADRLAEALAATEIVVPTAPVLSNVTGEPHGGPEEIRQRLLEQLTRPVLWRRNCEYLLEAGAEPFLEFGPGRVLAGLMKRINRRARVISLNGADALDAFADG